MQRQEPEEMFELGTWMGRRQPFAALAGGLGRRRRMPAPPQGWAEVSQARIELAGALQAADRYDAPDRGQGHQTPGCGIVLKAPRAFSFAAIMPLCPMPTHAHSLSKLWLSDRV